MQEIWIIIICDARAQTRRLLRIIYRDTTENMESGVLSWQSLVNCCVLSLDAILW